ncbi:MAG: dockerin type I repeat-containing protein [Phycisphaerales bacterium]|nr:dockerin type I repeat-containing protein [Phycisphaerales bacterium]
MYRISAAFASLAVAGLAASASAQSFAVVPEARANERGTSGLNTLTRNDGFPRTYQQQFVEAELAAQGLMPGMTITGVTWRTSIVGSNPPTWPPAGGATWSDYQITLAEAANPISAMSTTFADNMLNPVLVRSGELTIPEGAFASPDPAAPAPNPWGHEVTFDPYIYQGGDLVILYSHPGSDITTNVFLDVVVSNDAWGRAASASSFLATSGTSISANFTINRLSFESGPTCPPDLNGDGVVDADDFFLFLQLFADGDPRADFNNDGVIDADDFFAFLNAFAQGC